MHKRVFIKLPKDRITITLGMSHNLCGSQASYNLIPLIVVIPALFLVTHNDSNVANMLCSGRDCEVL